MKKLFLLSISLLFVNGIKCLDGADGGDLEDQDWGSKSTFISLSPTDASSRIDAMHESQDKLDALQVEKQLRREKKASGTSEEIHPTLEEAISEIQKLEQQIKALKDLLSYKMDRATFEDFSARDYGVNVKTLQDELNNLNEELVVLKSNCCVRFGAWWQRVFGCCFKSQKKTVKNEAEIVEPEQA